MYQALYRKYRPRSFEDVIGQDHITKTLRRQIETGRTSHAYLFVGSRGTGKTTCAKILSRALNCEHPVNGDPCNQCASCRGIESGGIMDVVEIDAASNNGVENIRTIRDEAMFSPASVRRRVYIIDEVHMLSTAAFNALLKILEEPPEHLVFILATTELRKIPATILSRCQRFSFKRIMPEDIVYRLGTVARSEGIELTDGAASLLARLADGALRDALSLLDQCIGDEVVDENKVLSAVGLSGSGDTAELWRAIAASDAQRALTIFEKLYQNGTDPAALLGEVLSLTRDMMMLKLAPNAGENLMTGAFSPETLVDLSRGISAQRLLDCSDLLQDALKNVANVKDKRTAAELCILRLMGAVSGAARREEPAPAPMPAFTPAPPAPKAEAPVREFRPEMPPEPVFDPKPIFSEEDLGFMPEEPGFMPPDFKNDPPFPSEPVFPAEREPVPAAPAPTVPAGDGSWWDQVLRSVKGKIDGPQYTFLSDRLNLAASVAGSNLVLTAKNDFIRIMVDNSDVKAEVGRAATEVLGKPMVVKIVVGTAPNELREDKLDELSKFSNIKFY